MITLFERSFDDAIEGSENVVDAKEIVAAIASGADVIVKNAAINGDIDLRSYGRDNLSKKKNIDINSKVIFERVTLRGSIVASFDGFIFKKEIRFKNSRFLKGCDFTRATFEDEVEFWEVEFEGVMDFWQATFLRRVSFFSCSFNNREGARFFRTNFRNSSFLAAKFVGNARFQEAKFQGSADFNLCSFASNAYFDRAEFSTADFSQANFCGVRADFVGAKATEEMKFEQAQFRCPMSFVGFHFGASLTLDSSIIDAPVNMVAAEFRGPINSLNSVLNDTIDVSWDQIGSAVKDYLDGFMKLPDSKEGTALPKNLRWSLCEATLLSWAQNFTKRGRVRDAHRVGFTWTCLRRTRKDKSLWWAIGDRLLDIPSQRGTKPWRPLWVAVMVIAGFALVYALGETLLWPFGVRAFESPSGAIAWYHPLLLSAHHFMPAMKPALVGTWELTAPYQTIMQIEILVGWAWIGLTAWSIRESFF